MVSILSSHKFKAMLCWHTRKQPLFYNNTWWYGKYTVVKQWLEIYPHVLEVNRKIADKDQLDWAGRASRPSILTWIHCSRSKLRLLRYLDSFHKTHKAMQKKEITLESCQEYLYGWVAQLESRQDLVGDKLYGCRLGTNWIKRNARIVTNVHFENAVVKLQREQHDTLTLDEMEAAKCLLQEDLDDDQSYSSGDEGGNDEMVMSLCTCAEANKRRRLSVQ
jgi:hypothetical protein